MTSYKDLETQKHALKTALERVESEMADLARKESYSARDRVTLTSYRTGLPVRGQIANLPRPANELLWISLVEDDGTLRDYTFRDLPAQAHMIRKGW